MIMFGADQQAQVIKEYQSGKTLKYLGDKWFCNPYTIRNVLIRNQVKIRPRTAYDKPCNDLIVAQIRVGMTYDEIAQKLGMSRQAVYIRVWRSKRRST